MAWSKLWRKSAFHINWLLKMSPCGPCLERANIQENVSSAAAETLRQVCSHTGTARGTGRKKAGMGV